MALTFGGVVIIPFVEVFQNIILLIIPIIFNIIAGDLLDITQLTGQPIIHSALNQDGVFTEIKEK